MSKPRRRRTVAVRPEPLEGRHLLTTVVALSDNNQLFRFDAGDPTTPIGIAAISGLNPGENVLGIDARPATGELYGLSSQGALLVLDPTGGSVLRRVTLAADPADATSPFAGLVGTRFGIDFNPTVDRLRVVSDADQNLRINPNTGATITDTDLAYAGGTPDPSVAQVAYTNNVPTATTTTLFDLDDGTGGLVQQSPPNDGTLVPVAIAAPRPGSFAGFDIAPDGTAYVAGLNGTAATLNTLNTTSAALTSLGALGTGTSTVRDLAVIPDVAFSATIVAVNENVGSALVTIVRSGGTALPASIRYRTQDGSARAGDDYTATSGRIDFGAGEASRTVAIPIVNELRAENDETFLVLLEGGGATIGSTAAIQVRINANDRNVRVGPRLISFFTETTAAGITGFTFRFDRDLDPASAQFLGNYQIIGQGGGRRRTIGLATASYDAIQREVTITPAAPVTSAEYSRLSIRVRRNLLGADGVRFAGLRRSDRPADANFTVPV